LVDISLDFIQFLVNLTAKHNIIAFRFHCLVKPFTDAVCLRAVSLGSCMLYIINI
jgi:hypothetical protein